MMRGRAGETLKAMGITLALARVRTPVRTMLERTGFMLAIGEDHIYASVEAGAEAFGR